MKENKGREERGKEGIEKRKKIFIYSFIYLFFFFFFFFQRENSFFPINHRRTTY